MLWDIRRSRETLKLEPVAELDGHTGPVTHLHMDPYKVVTAGPEDLHVNIWETDTGTQTNSLLCCSLEDSKTVIGCSALAVNGCRIATATYSIHGGDIKFCDFSHAACPISKDEDQHDSKFWEPPYYGDTHRIPAALQFD